MRRLAGVVCSACKRQLVRHTRGFCSFMMLALEQTSIYLEIPDLSNIDLIVGIQFD